jgi:hypothetical protein
LTHGHHGDDEQRVDPDPRAFRIAVLTSSRVASSKMRYLGDDAGEGSDVLVRPVRAEQAQLTRLCATSGALVRAAACGGATTARALAEHLRRKALLA